MFGFNSRGFKLILCIWRLRNNDILYFTLYNWHSLLCLYIGRGKPLALYSRKVFSVQCLFRLNSLIAEVVSHVFIDTIQAIQVSILYHLLEGIQLYRTHAITICQCFRNTGQCFSCADSLINIRSISVWRSIIHCTILVCIVAYPVLAIGNSICTGRVNAYAVLTTGSNGSCTSIRAI